MTASRTRRLSPLLVALALGSGLLSACNAQSDDEPRAAGPAAAPAGAEQAQDAPATQPAPALVTNLERPRRVAVDQVVEVSAQHADLRRVQVMSKAGPVPGKLTNRGWRATGRLEPGTDYRIIGRVDQGGEQRTVRSRFHTADLTLDEQTYASVAPLDGETVGVGMPVIVTFDLPVADKAAFERHMSVTSTPQQKGSWHWISDTEAHYRPATYWQPGTDVTVDVDVNSVAAGGGIYGQESRQVGFHVGDAVVSKVNAATHQMQTFVNGELARTIPITTGKPGFTTRSGVKVIMEKFDEKRMSSETIGISEGDAEYYDIDDVQWAMRLTHSGEFIHAAPWSVGSQGSANVSHGCTGLSTENAKWLYDISKRGDVVEYTGTDRPMTLTNGYGDWNADYASYAAGSALH